MTPPADPTRVLIVDDQALMREGLQTLLELDKTIDVVGTAANGHDAVVLARERSPHVVLMDIRMPGQDGIAATLALKAAQPEIQVLMLTTFDEDDLIFAALQAGASGYVLKDTPSEQLARDIHAVRSGDASLSPSVARKVIGELRARDIAPRPTLVPTPQHIDAEGRETLSEREREVLRLAAQGLSNREIGLRLYIAEGTVKNHISSVLSKLHLRDRTQAVLYAREHGLL
jgi:DNA-binding NarL/FixJ family response regulator